MRNKKAIASQQQLRMKEMGVIVSATFSVAGTGVFCTEKTLEYNTTEILQKGLIHSIVKVFSNEEQLCVVDKTM